MVEALPFKSLKSADVVGIDFNQAGDKLIVAQSDGVYFYYANNMVADRKYDTSRKRTEPGYLGSTEIHSVSSSPNKEWIALGQWQHYNSAKGSVQRGVITILQVGNGFTKILGLDQNPTTMAAPFINVRYSPDNLEVAGEIDSNNGGVQVWETKGNLLYTLSVFHGLKSLDFSTQKQQLAICSNNGDVEVHDSKTGKWVASLGKFTTQNLSSASCGLAYSHNGALLAFYGDDQIINLWEPGGSNILRHVGSQNVSLNQIIFSPDDQNIATLGSDSTIRIWSIGGHKELFSWTDLKTGISWIRYSPDGHFLLGGGADGIIRIFNPINNRLIAKIEGKDAVFSPNGKLMAIYDSNNTVTLWQTDSFNPENVSAQATQQALKQTATAAPTQTATQVTLQTSTQVILQKPTTLATTQIPTQAPSPVSSQASLQTPTTQATAQIPTQVPSKVSLQTPTPATGTQIPTQALSQVSQQAPTQATTQIPAQTQTQSAKMSPEDTLLFSSLNYTDEAGMKLPYDSFYLGFGVPVNWELKLGAKLVLKLDMTFNKNNGQISSSTDLPGMVINVFYNGVNIGSIPVLDTGLKTYSFDLPMEVLNQSTDGVHTLYLSLDSGASCNYDLLNNVTIKMDSYVQLPHKNTTPVLDLSQWPLPIFQDLSFENIPVNIIIPDKPTDEESNTASLVAKSLSRRSQNKIVISTYNSSSINEQVLKAGHLIFVGKPNAFPKLVGLNFAAKIIRNSFNIPFLNADDGVIQMINSPWNPSNVLLFVSGNSENGIIKAGQAINSSKLPVGISRKNLSVISDYTSLDNQENTPVDLTFDILGNEIYQLNYLGISSRSFTFDLPVDKVFDANPYIILKYNLSQEIDSNLSGLSIKINNIPISSDRLSNDNSNGSTIKVQIPLYILKTSKNTLTIQSELYAKDTTCPIK